MSLSLRGNAEGFDHTLCAARTEHPLRAPTSAQQYDRRPPKYLNASVKCGNRWISVVAKQQ